MTKGEFKRQRKKYKNVRCVLCAHKHAKHGYRQRFTTILEAAGGQRPPVKGYCVGKVKMRDGQNVIRISECTCDLTPQEVLVNIGNRRSTTPKQETA